MSLQEWQIDRLVGPTHHFGGLGVGNLASQASGGNVSNPAAAAIQGLDKMRLVAGLGIPQLILPPQPRPHFEFLRSVGFAGTPQETLSHALDEAPEVLSSAVSCSAMWTANAATVTPGIDAGRTKTEVTIANLNGSLHRAIEPVATEHELRHLLSSVCKIHSPLTGGTAMRDEGAANHMRLGNGENRPGINLLIYGDGDPFPRIHWPRQTKLACQAVARVHGLAPENTFFFKQHPQAIDAGAFHNDVVAISHHDLLIHHELAFLEDEAKLDQLCNRYADLHSTPLNRIQISDAELSIADAVGTYLFNSQVISTPDSDRPSIICAQQVADHAGAKTIVQRWRETGTFANVHFVDLGQSMSGGGGPACLRLRVPIPTSMAGAVPHSQWTPEVDAALRSLIEREYPTALKVSDLVTGECHQHGLELVQRIQLILHSSVGS